MEQSFDFAESLQAFTHMVPKRGPTNRKRLSKVGPSCFECPHSLMMHGAEIASNDECVAIGECGKC